MLDLDKILALIEAMNREGVDYITFGALAMAVHGIPRATEDADFFVAPAKENIARLRRAIRVVWNDPEVEQITHEDLAGDYPAVRYGPPGEDFTIDFLTRLGEAYSYASLPSEIVEFDGIPIRVVTPDTLYEMKRDTVRHKDKFDADALRRKFGLKDR